jgi:hypothetical protein
MSVRQRVLHAPRSSFSPRRSPLGLPGGYDPPIPGWAAESSISRRPSLRPVGALFRACANHHLGLVAAAHPGPHGRQYPCSYSPPLLDKLGSADGVRWS